MKELTKEAAKRSNSSISFTSHISTSVPPSYETVPDIVPRQATAKPSLFHPSNIQSSSTPMKDAAVHRSTGTSELDSLLLDGEHDLPISGHHLSSGSSTNHDQDVDRISPIHDTFEQETNPPAKTGISSSGKRVEMVEDQQIPVGNLTGKSEPGLPGFERSVPREDRRKNSKVSSSGKRLEMVEDQWIPVGNVNGKLEPGLPGVERSLPRVKDRKNSKVEEEMCEVKKSEQGSPCSCRSLNTSYVVTSSQLDFERPSVELSRSFLPSVPRLPSSLADPHRLFAETKARMASARTNITDFLQSEKTRTADVSRSSGPVPVDRIGSRWITSLDHTGAVGDSVDRSLCSFEAVSVDRRDKGPYHPADDVVAMKTASCGRRTMSEEHSEQLSQDRRSWAEILEQSSGSFRSGQSITALPDLSCNEDIVAPELLNSLKVRIAELKRRQEQLERDQFLFMQPRPQTLSANVLPTTSVTRSDSDLVSSGSKPVNSLSWSSAVPLSDKAGGTARSQDGLHRSSAVCESTSSSDSLRLINSSAVNCRMMTESGITSSGVYNSDQLLPLCQKNPVISLWSDHISLSPATAAEPDLTVGDVVSNMVDVNSGVSKSVTLPVSSCCVQASGGVEVGLCPVSSVPADPGTRPPESMMMSSQGPCCDTVTGSSSAAHCADNLATVFQSCTSDSMATDTQSVDCESVASTQACANDNAAMLLERRATVQGGMTESVPGTVTVLPAGTHNGDMIQQLTSDEANELSQSV